MDSRTRMIEAGGPGSGYPSAYPQPGIASIFPPYPQGAENPLLPIPGSAPDPRSWRDGALLRALGIQAAIEHPHVRALLGDLIDKSMRNSFKPVALPPWVEKPYRAQYFGGVVTHDVAILPADDVWGTITNVAGGVSMSYTVPEGFMGVIKEFAQTAANATDWEYVSWRVRIDGNPVAPLMDVCSQIGTLESKQKLTILVPGGSTVDVQVEVAAGAAAGGIADMGAWLLGWFWPVPNEGDVDNAQGQATVA
jgi:hypothetical protein